MTTKLKKQWWADKVWDGCLIVPSNIQTAACLAAAPLVLPKAFSWSEYAVPTINQHGPSCCGQSWANWFEMMLRRYLGMACLASGEQLDGYAIWKRGRELYYNGKLTGGLYLWQGFAAMVDLGIVPPGSTLITLYPDLDEICAQLTLTPLVQGHLVTEGWYNPNPENGCLDHSKLPLPNAGGHATVLMGNTDQNNQEFMINQGSWGPDYGLGGFFTMSWDFWNRCYIGEGPCTAKLPQGWESWDGWKRYVTKDAQ